MSQTPLFVSETNKSAYIRDNALILYFEAAETPLVARFDLDSLVQANFEVTKKDEMFALVLRDFSGQRQEITTFANKADAHQALHAILQALLSYGENKRSDEKKPSLLWKFIKGILIGLILVVIAAFVLIWLATPVSHTTVPEAAPKEAMVPSAPLPEGEPMDMNQMISPALQAAPEPVPAAVAPTDGLPPGMENPEIAPPSDKAAAAPDAAAPQQEAAPAE